MIVTAMLTSEVAGGEKARKRSWSQTVGYRLSCLEGCAILRKCSIKLVVYSITVAKSYRGIRQNWGTQNGVKNECGEYFCFL